MKAITETLIVDIPCAPRAGPPVLQYAVSTIPSKHVGPTQQCVPVQESRFVSALMNQYDFFAACLYNDHEKQVHVIIYNFAFVLLLHNDSTDTLPSI